MAPKDKISQAAPDPSEAVFARLQVLTKRADFVATSKAKRHATPGIHLQARNRGDDLPPRVGFTCTKKVGNAVARNRAKRRLREIAHLELPKHAHAGWDYVLVGRKDTTATLPFTQLRSDLVKALKRVHP